MAADGPNGGRARTRPRLHLGAELTLAAIPTAVVLLVLILLGGVSRPHVLFASLASGGPSIDRDPLHSSFPPARSTPLTA
jgi:hypothetical protein